MTEMRLTAAAIIALALAACGTTTKSSSFHGSGSGSQPIEFANCMRAHGVPSFPDPTAGGGGINLPAGINPQSPAFKTARQQTCAKPTPGGSGPLQATESQFLAAVKLAKCLRKHGFPDFPDPTRTDSPAPILVAGPGLFFHLTPTLNPNTPQVNQAVAACGGSSR